MSEEDVMNEPRLIQIELTGDEVTLLEAHLKRHLDQVDKELVRTENHTSRTPSPAKRGCSRE